MVNQYISKRTRSIAIGFLHDAGIKDIYLVSRGSNRAQNLLALDVYFIEDNRPRKITRQVGFALGLRVFDEKIKLRAALDIEAFIREQWAQHVRVYALNVHRLE